MGQSTSERDRDRRGFKELAKLAGPASRPKAGSISGIRRATDPTSTEHDSGMVDLEVLASSDPGAVDRASVTPLASATLFEDEPVARKSAPKAIPSSPASRPSAPPAAASSGRALQSQSPGPLVSPSELRPIVSAQATLRTGFAPELPARRRSPMVGLSAAVGLVAIAAGAFFVVRSVRAPQASEAAGAQAVVTPSHAVADTPAAVAQAPAPTPAADPGVDPLSLPKETAAATAGHHSTHAWHGAHGGGQTLVAKADPKEDESAPPPAKAEAPAVAAAPPPPPPPPANNALFNSIKMAAANAPPPAAPASPAADAVPVPAAAAVGPTAAAANGVAQRPSQGQVTGALGGVLPAARGCLGDDDGVSRAHVVFGSDGAVQSVSISGFAAGKPAEACIKTALGKAHVPPFAEASYGATVTVRP